jgi:hypothetical protein
LNKKNVSVSRIQLEIVTKNRKKKRKDQVQIQALESQFIGGPGMYPGAYL